MTIKQREVKHKENFHDSIALLATYSNALRLHFCCCWFILSVLVLTLSDVFFNMFRVTSVVSAPKSACARRSLPAQRHNRADLPVQPAFSLRLYVLFHFLCPCPNVSVLRPPMRAPVYVTLFVWLLNDAAAHQFTEEEMAVIR